MRPLRTILLPALALCALVLIAYGNTLANGFVWDDHEQIVMNPYIKPGAPFAPLFTADVRFAHQGPSLQTPAYRPLQLLTYRFVAALFDDSPAAFHAVNLFFAIATTLTAFAVFWLLLRNLSLAFAAAALFAVHPVHTEAVDWIAALPDLGVTFFTLLAFAFFLKARRPTPAEKPKPHRKSQQPAPTPRPWLLPTLSLVAFVLALLWKETAVVLPVLIALYLALIEKGPLPRVLKQTTPYLLVLAAYLAWRFAVLGAFTTGPRDWVLDPIQFAFTALHLLLQYWARLVLPIHLNAYYVFHPLHSFADPTALLTLFLGLAAVAALYFLLRRAPLPAFASLWICLALLPALNLNALGRNAFAERYLYLPSAGFCLLVVLLATWLIERLPLPYRRSTGLTLLLLVLAAFTTQTIARNPVWKDDDSLFGETLKLSPDAPFVRLMVASGESADPSQSTAAEQNYLQTIALAQQQIPPDRLDTVSAYQGLASLYADRSQYDRALQVLAQARQLAPDNAGIAAQEGIILARAGHGAQSEERLTQALAVQPNNENVLAALALIARDDHHDLTRAAELFHRALAAHPQQDDFAASQHNNLGAVYADQDNLPAAIAEFKQAIAITPADPEFHVNLATAFAASGRFTDAHAEAETALKIAPNDPNAQEILRRLSQQR